MTDTLKRIFIKCLIYSKIRLHLSLTRLKLALYNLEDKPLYLMIITMSLLVLLSEI